jgi:hypothetical protein
MRRLLSVALLVVPGLAACGSNVTVVPQDEPLGGGGGGVGGAGGEGGTAPVPDPHVKNVRAPDEHSVAVEFTSDPGDALESALAYAIDSAAVGPLAVDSVSYDPATHVATLGTPRQKLGIEYTLTITSPGSTVDGEGASFLSADTARFLATDFGSFEKYELVADRLAVGDRTVVYLEQGQMASGADDLVDYFENQVWPIETELFTDPLDFDGNDGKVVFLGLDGGPYYGGYFDPTDEYPSGQFGWPSNEVDMIYLNTAFGYLAEPHTVAHEFQHMLYHAEHGLSLQEDWAYHNEGLSECAVRLVLGQNDYAVQTFYADPDGLLAQGISLVNWQFANFTQYALAYMFWTYLAAQLDGTDTYGELFHLPTGSPANVDAFVQQKLGVGFGIAQMRMMMATWVQAPSGMYSFTTMETLPGPQPPAVSTGTTSVELEPFTGAFFKLATSPVDYPGSQGPNILYAGVQGGVVDFDAPFDVSGGALLVMNTTLNPSFPTEPSGPDLPALMPPQDSALFQAAMAMTHPPIINPHDMRPMERWRRAVLGR